MIANPRDVAVRVLDGEDVEDKIVTIEINPDGNAPPASFFYLSGEDIIADSASARALSRWALDRGAKGVRFDFDLRFER